MPHRIKTPFHPRTVRQRHERRGLLSLRDATAMAVGGMIGGGIFSVLGVTVALAGHLAAACFVIGGAIAMMTAHSFAVLSIRAGTSGGLFSYLRNAGYPRMGAFASWLLIFGYVVALAVYSYTFGHYAAHILGLPIIFARLFSVFILSVFLLVNLRGVTASALTEDVVVLIKVVVLALIAVIGLAHFSPDRLTPLANQGITNVFIATTAIFVAYEGFELLSYDYGDIEKPRRTLPRALYLSVGLVALIYVSVTIASQMLVSDKLIISQKEVAFAGVGQAALGVVGKWIATLAALLATSSAINATLFATARQTHEIASAGELPATFAKSRNGLPVSALIMLAVFGSAFAMLPGILELLTFGSAVFLAVFAVTNYLAYRVAATFWQRLVTAVATAACTAAIIILLIQLARHDHATLLLIALCLAVISVARLIFIWPRWRLYSSSN